MENPRPQKVQVIDEVKEKLSASNAVLVSEYRGLSVTELSTLRRNLRSSGGVYKVYKNTLVRRAASEAGYDFGDTLLGPTALTFAGDTPEGGRGDVVGVAKALKEFAKDSPNLVIKGGILDGQFLDAEAISALAEVEPREVLLAKLAGGLAAPMVQFAGLLQAIPRNFAYGLAALIDQGGAPGAPESSPVTSDAEPVSEEISVEATPAEDPSSAVENETESENSADADTNEDASAEAEGSE